MGPLKHPLKRNDSDPSTARILALLWTLQSADFILLTTNGQQLRLRRITGPSPEQRQLLHQLRIAPPERLEMELEYSENSALV